MPHFSSLADTGRWIAGRTRRAGAWLALAGVAALAGAVVLLQARRRARRPAAHVSLRPGPITQSLVSINAADAPLGAPGRNTELRLDEAIQETFPASDPIAVHIE